MLSAQAVPATPPVGAFTKFDLGTLFDNDNVPVNSISVLIQWGDGTNSLATLTPTVPNTFDITGSHTYLAAGPLTITLMVFEGMAASVASASTAVLAGGPLVNTSATVVSSSSPASDFGQAVTLTADVTAVPPGSGTPTGIVTFVIDGAIPGTAAALTGGVATLVTKTLLVGANTIQAIYAGSTTFLASSDTLTQTVNPDIALAPALANWTQNAPNYKQAVYLGGGTVPPLAFGISAGALPPGLALDPDTGAVTGTPTTPGTFSFTIRAHDKGDTAVMSYTVTINAMPSLSPGWFPILTVGVPFNQTLTATGGTGGKVLTFTIQGTLPPGLKITPAGNSLTISGTSTAAGTAGIMIFIVDATGGKREVCGPLVCLANASRPRWAR